MKIINVTPILPYGLPYTVDRTTTTVDSTLVTVDTTLDNEVFVNYLVITPSTFSSTYTVVILNELTKIKSTYSGCTATKDNGIVSILLPSLTLAEGDRLEVEVYIANKRVWSGKALATDQTDLQNYQLSTTTNNKIRF